MNEDIRWIQRYENYRKALSRLEDAVTLSTTRPLSDLEKQGLIQAFEFTYELAWNTVKDFYESMGETDIQGSIDAFRLAFNRGLVSMGEELLNSVRSRRLSSHTDNDEIANGIYHDIVHSYIFAFRELRDNLSEEKKKME